MILFKHVFKLQSISSRQRNFLCIKGQWQRQKMNILIVVLNSTDKYLFRRCLSNPRKYAIRFSITLNVVFIPKLFVHIFKLSTELANGLNHITNLCQGIIKYFNRNVMLYFVFMDLFFKSLAISLTFSILGILPFTILFNFYHNN